MLNRASFKTLDILWVTLMVWFSVGSTVHAAIPWPGERWPAASPESQGLSSPIIDAVLDLPIFPDKHWAEKSPSQAGMDAEKLNALKNATQAKEGCVIRHGNLVYQWGDISTVRGFASAYKPVNSTMLLFALKEGLIDSVDDRVRPWVQKVFTGKDLAEKDRTMTFRHLCNMTSGYALPEKPGDACGYNDRGIALKRMLLYGYEKWGNGTYGVFNEDSVIDIDKEKAP